MKNRCLSFSALLLATACGGSQATTGPVAPGASDAARTDAWRAQAPHIGSAPALHAPIPDKKVLANGLTLLSVRKSDLPLVSVAVTIRSGSAADPKGLEGLAGFTADMLKMGTTSRSAAALAQEVEAQGTSIEFDVDEDSMTFAVTALKSNMGTVLDVLGDMLQHPAFARDEIERIRAQRLAALAASEDEPRATANSVFRRIIYGDHPYGHTALGTASALKKISSKQLKDFFATHFRPSNAAAVVVGDLSIAETTAAIEPRLGGWVGGGAATNPPTPPVERAGELTLVARPGAPQSELFIGELAVSRGDPDYFPLVLCNAILGGLFNSRINMNLRENKGYTYGAHSMFDFMRERGPFFVSTGVRTDVTVPAITEVLKEITAMRTTDVSAEELQNAKSRYALSLSGKFQTVDAISGLIASLYLFDLAPDFYQRLPEQLNSVSIADVRRVAERHLHPDKLTIVVVGDDKTIAAGLGELKHGPVHRRDARGNML